MSLSCYYADLHIHIGRNINNRPVKITGSKSLTLTNILKEASRNKGIQIVGIVDSHVPSVQVELEQLMAKGLATEHENGGIQFEEVTLFLGSEIEIYDKNCQGPIHVLCFFPNLAIMKNFTNWISKHITNIHLSSQRYYGNGKDLQYKVKELGGLFIPAHVFTPFKSLYGKGVKQSLLEVFDPDLIDAIELGLSADTAMADCISEIHRYTFLTNSDAHSLAKIAREYQTLRLENPTFYEFALALAHIQDRKVITNYGMNPLLGKYNRTVCAECFQVVKAESGCICGSTKVVKGVRDRINELKDTSESPDCRAPYIYQVPLEYIPSLGPKTYNKLLARFGTEMKILHEATESELKEVVKDNIASAIVGMRKGVLPITAGGGGKYGKVSPIK
ncbi:endonuclease Q family protein [Aquibacillus albus]|uniref:Uncharacterized protein (TIGR00375 family) n=1 Tax=Aquibacillus albus TaxID=1168171 RepID=A0ABS2MV82_9BACI|nr:endonuclease Q family protein [Aquibacillus albus]MBM7569757.1 uncharacterized protein (TIGR00375 family) [Aquibacillus albus]